MVIYEDTLEPCHPLTEEGEKNYRKFLEYKADEILYKHEHPIIFLYQFIKTLIGK